MPETTTAAYIKLTSGAKFTEPTIYNPGDSRTTSLPINNTDTITFEASIKEAYSYDADTVRKHLDKFRDTIGLTDDGNATPETPAEELEQLLDFDLPVNNHQLILHLHNEDKTIRLSVPYSSIELIVW